MTEGGSGDEEYDSFGSTDPSSALEKSHQQAAKVHNPTSAQPWASHVVMLNSVETGGEARILDIQHQREEADGVMLPYAKVSRRSLTLRLHMASG